MRLSIARVFWIMLVLAVALVVGAAVVLRPYYRMPPESKEALDAKLAAYQAEADEMANRPKEARQALDKLIADLTPVLATIKEEPDGGGCPTYDLKRLATLQPQFAALDPYGARFRALTQYPFALQLVPAFHKDYFYLLGNVDRLVRWETAASVAGMHFNRRIEAVDHLIAVIRFSDCLLRTPLINTTHSGFSGLAYVDSAIVFRLPQFQLDEIRRLRRELERLPDTRAMVIKALRVDTAVNAAALCRFGTVVFFPTLAFDHKRTFLVVLWLGQVSGFATRLKYRYLSICEREIDGMESWLAAGGDEPYLSAVPPEEIQHDLWLRGGNNFVALGNATRDMQRRAAILSALQLELRRRQGEANLPTEIPYDATQRIVRAPEYGCIVKNEGKK